MNLPRPITVRTEQVDEWTQAITFEKPLPFVTIVTDRALDQSDVLAGMLRLAGYRAVERDIYIAAERYVRPLPLWVVHWLVVRAHRRYWNALGWLVRRGVLRLAVGPEVMPRFRDLRPWPMKGAR